MPHFSPINAKLIRPLTDEEYWKGMIIRYDFNGDGCLDKGELTALFRTLGATFPGWRASQALKHVSKSRDVNHYHPAQPIIQKIVEKKIKEPAKYAVKVGNKLNDGADLRRGELNDLRLTEEAFKYLSLYIPGYRARCGLSYGDVNGDGHDKEEELGNIIKCAVKFGYRFKDSDFIVREQILDEALTKEDSHNHHFADGDRDKYITREDFDELVNYIKKSGFTVL